MGESYPDLMRKFSQPRFQTRKGETMVTGLQVAFQRQSGTLHHTIACQRPKVSRERIACSYPFKRFTSISSHSSHGNIMEAKVGGYQAPSNGCFTEAFLFQLKVLSEVRQFGFRLSLCRQSSYRSVPWQMSAFVTSKISFFSGNLWQWILFSQIRLNEAA